MPSRKDLNLFWASVGALLVLIVLVCALLIIVGLQDRSVCVLPK